MGFFKDLVLKANGLPTEAEQKKQDALKMQVASLYVLAQAIDNEVDFEDDVTLLNALQFDLLNFAMFIASADGHIDQSEIDAINEFLGMNLTRQQCDLLTRDSPIGSKEATEGIPESFMMLSACADLSGIDAREFALGMVITYFLLGDIIASADGYADAKERAEVAGYARKLQALANMF